MATLLPVYNVQKYWLKQILYFPKVITIYIISKLNKKWL
jgi:hypothetical protein